MNTNKIGIFYTNNNPKGDSRSPTIDLSLQTIKRASEGKADIITSVWSNIKNNPFTEHVSWVKIGGHLNQCLQILHLLYVAKEKQDYEYVCFLEHDVLYPEGYFDFPDFKEGDCLANMNYIGLKKEGFQKLKQKDRPLHQMVMRFNDAIFHFETVFRNALVLNHGVVDYPKNVKRYPWLSEHPSVHVNHGHHFTSHYRVFHNETCDKIDYWGNAEDYSYLFNA